MRPRTAWLTGALGIALLCTAGVASSQISIGVSVRIAPPALPLYTQPPIPAPGTLWVPGYWAWSDAGGYYYWVPGTWVEPPQPGLLWTPGYWGWVDGAYVWHEGYWGPTVGFYGGVDYGFGYGPGGYDGGRWDHGVFYYNSAVNRIPPGLHLDHVYRHPMPIAGPPSRVSFNGGAGGLRERPSPAQLNASHEQHLMPMAAQRQLVDSASHSRQMRADINHGRPGVAATARPDAFSTGEAARAPQRPAGVAPLGRGPARQERPAVPGPQAPASRPSEQRAPVEQRAQRQPHPAARPQQQQGRERGAAPGGKPDERPR